MADLRVSLNEKAIARLPLATDGQYKVRDTDLKGFYLLIGKRRRTYMIQGDLRQQGMPPFLANGRICLTNKAAERALRGIALGRK